MFNQMAGGVEAIEQNAAEHARTGHPIAYASMCDPLLQLAMDEAVIPVSEQRRIADIALVLALEMGIPITRVIDRAFVKTPDGEYVRTANRHDAVLPLPGSTLVDILTERGVRTVAVGKTSDLVNTVYSEELHLSAVDQGVDLRFVHPKKKDTNPFTMQGVLHALNDARNDTFIFANCVDTDALYGHTRDVDGAIHCIEECDRVLPMIEARLQMGDLLIITADHGMEHRADYGYHNREPVPLLVKRVGRGKDLGGMEFGQTLGLTQVGDLVAQMFGCAGEFRRSIIKIPA
ncbi:MAG: hypothetical protein HY569_02185 [Candidatus Magasanikbacteria bacterium]|nr:hypothetical protein [Candidatus Magasanikbacteria bacterium]